MIHLIVGNTGSGKTTYSNQLRSQTKGVIFSIDKWNKELFLQDKKDNDGLEWFLERINRSENIILNLIKQLEDSGVDSILDLGLSKFEHRKKFRDYAVGKCFDHTIHFLDIPKEIRSKRVRQRNQEKGDTFEFEITDENFKFMETWFERPTEEEMVDGVLIIE